MLIINLVQLIWTMICHFISTQETSISIVCWKHNNLIDTIQIIFWFNWVYNIFFKKKILSLWEPLFSLVHKTKKLDNSDGLNFLIMCQNFKIKVKYVHNYIILYCFAVLFIPYKKESFWIALWQLIQSVLELKMNLLRFIWYF